MTDSGKYAVTGSRTASPLLEHGGRIRAAAARWGIPRGDWLDLSTGIAPEAYPVPPPAPECWHRLPEEEDGLDAAAQAYYGTSRLLALPGSQAAIQALPRLLPQCLPSDRVAILTPGYGEYAAHWQAAGHTLRPFAAHELETLDADCRVAILGNPNNPTGARFSRERLLAAAARLRRHDGLLLVDEAFADAEPADSLATLAGGEAAPNVVVLRSLGKFFGLAGARVGFAIAAAELLSRLAASIGPWAVSHPARAAAHIALADHAWQTQQQQYLTAASRRLETLLHDAGLGATTGCTLFRYVVTPHATSIAAALAGQGILVREFVAPPALRFGLPGAETEWRRLAEALQRALPHPRRAASSSSASDGTA